MKRAELDIVPNKKLREAIIRRGIRTRDIADELGFYRTNRHGKKTLTPDDVRIRRQLGMAAEQSVRVKGKHYYQKGLNYEKAVAICRAAGIDPVDVDL